MFLAFRIGDCNLYVGFIGKLVDLINRTYHVLGSFST